MSCNAWNHQPDCTCGWGGVFYGAGYKDGADDSWHWQKSSSHTTPNAHCPKCNHRVFFYRSPYGGSVYFDELGPPWPKHPCMDTSSSVNTSSTHKISSPKINRPLIPKDREKGWRPLICDAIHRHERYPTIVVLSVQNGPDGTATLYSVFERKLLDHRTPFVARVAKNGSIEISTLNTQIAVPTELRLLAYESLKECALPLRDKSLGKHPGKTISSPTSSTQHESIQVDSKTKKFLRTDPSQVEITYKHRRPDSFKPIQKRSLLKKEAKDTVKGELPVLNSMGSTNSPLNQKKYLSDSFKPMTAMELAFQKFMGKNTK